MENFKVIENHLFDKITKVNDRKKHCINEIKRVRTSVKERLDKIERDILDELSQKEINIKQNIEMLANQIESKKRRVVNLQDSLLKTKKYATDLKIFLSIKEMEKQTSEDAKYLEDLEKGDQMALNILEFDISPALQSLQRDFITFGTISVTSVPSTLKFTRTSQGQAQLLLPVVSTVDNVHPEKILTIDIAKPLHITACALLPTGECIVAEYKNDCLLFYNKKGIYVRDVVKISGLPSDMCYIKENIVGISFPAEEKVNFVDFSENKIVKIKQMQSSCYGIDCDNGQIFVGLPDVNAVAIMNLDGKKLKSVIIPEKDITRIACFKNYIYCTNSETSEVSCYDMKGKMVWKHKYEALIEPWSIAIDKRLSIIYVAGYDSNNLFAISLNGNQSKIVLSEKNGVNGIKSINIENKQLVCYQSDGFILLYQL